MQSKEQIEHEIIQRKARELELSKAYEDNHDALMFALGRKQCYDEVMADMDRRIKEAVEKALATGEKVEPQPQKAT